MASALSPRSTFTSLTYANAVKRLTFSHVPRCEKIEICRHLLSSRYHPDPSTTVLNFLCSLIAKEAPSVEDCYTIRNSNSIPEHAIHDWTLLTHAIRRYTQTFRDHTEHREAPLIPNAVLVQGGLHLLRGSYRLRTTVAETLHVVLKQAQYSQDLETHTWLFCAIARAEGLSSVLAPLRAVMLSQFSRNLSHEHDKDRIAAAAASVASHGVPSPLASELEKIVVQSIRASPCTFHDRFAAWVLRGETSLPQAVQFLLRAYAKHPPKASNDRPSSKRILWEPARRDALEFFEACTDHILQAIRAGGDQRAWGEQEYHSQMKAIQILYLIGSENAAYLPLQAQSECQGSKRKKSRNGANRQSTQATGLHGLLHELIGISSSLHLEARVNKKRVQLTFQAICAIAKFSLDTIDELLPDLLSLCLIGKDKLHNADGDVSNECELFCALALSYEQSRVLDKFLDRLMKIGSLHSLTTVLRQKPVQEMLGAAFSRLREAEAQACIQALLPSSHLPAKDVSARTLISSLLLETIGTPFLRWTAISVGNQIVDSLLRHPMNSEIRQCRTHLLSSFLIAKTSNPMLSTEEDVRVAMLRLAFADSVENRVQNRVPVESALLDALSAGQESLNAAELCSNLRCLTTLAHYSSQSCEDSDGGEFITRVLQTTFAQFGVLDDLCRKSGVSKNGDSLSSIFYGSVTCGLVLPWLGSLASLLARFSFVEKGNEIVSFLSRALEFFPATHPFWYELSEERMWGPAVMAASCVVLGKQSRYLRCEGDLSSCPLSRILASVSVIPQCFFVGPDHGKLLHTVLHCITVPCCSNSRQEGLNAIHNFGNTSDLRKVLLTFLPGSQESVQKATHHLNNSPTEGRSLSPDMLIIVVMRVIASQRPEKQLSLLSQDLAAPLGKAILGLKVAYGTDLEPRVSSPERLYETMGALFDLLASLESAKDIGVAAHGLSTVEDAATECIKLALPLCVRSLSMEVSRKISDSEAAEYMLWAMVKDSSPIYKHIFSDEECSRLHHVLSQTYMPILFHAMREKRDLINLLLFKLPVYEGSSRQRICQVLLALLDKVLKQVRCCLPSVLRGDENEPMEPVSKLISMATRLTVACAQLCNISRYPLMETPETAQKGVPVLRDSHAHAIWCYSASIKMLSGLEAFLRTWNCEVQELSARQMTKLRKSTLLRTSDSLASSSLKTCLEVTAANRSLSRGDMEKIVLLTRQVVERVCSCKAFLLDEAGILLNALRICRTAVRRHSGLLPVSSQVIAVLFRRGITTENMVVIGAVREAVEELCNISKTWDVLSALLADCSAALDETTWSDSRREAEKSMAFLFKAVGERRAQLVLSCLNDSGRESLKQVWELFSDKLQYSGK